MIYYISDLHFGHANIIKLCSRPFQNLEEMNNVLINNWNSKVTHGDKVYIVGDLFFRSQNNLEEILSKLKGKKYLIVGNYDKSWLKKVDISKYFESIDNMLIFGNGKNKIMLCHYPMMSFEGDYLIHGHIHNNKNAGYWNLLKYG